MKYVIKNFKSKNKEIKEILKDNKFFKEIFNEIISITTNISNYKDIFLDLACPVLLILNISLFHLTDTLVGLKEYLRVVSWGGDLADLWTFRKC